MSTAAMLLLRVLGVVLLGLGSMALVLTGLYQTTNRDFLMLSSSGAVVVGFELVGAALG